MTSSFSNRPAFILPIGTQVAILCSRCIFSGCMLSAVIQKTDSSIVKIFSDVLWLAVQMLALAQATYPAAENSIFWGEFGAGWSSLGDD